MPDLTHIRVASLPLPQTPLNTQLITSLTSPLMMCIKQNTNYNDTINTGVTVIVMINIDLAVLRANITGAPLTQSRLQLRAFVN